MDFMNFSEVNYSSYDNISSNGPVDDFGPLPSFQAQWVVAMVIYVVVFVVGILGNALVLWVTGSEARRSVNAIWFLNLAVVDLLSCLALPIHITTILMDGDWVFGEMACRILITLFYFNFYASVLLLATISANRFLLVFKPVWCQNYHVAWWAWLASGVTWILALVLTIPYFVFGALEDSISKKAYCGLNVMLVAPELVDAMIMTLCPDFPGPPGHHECLLHFAPAWARRATRSNKTLKVVVAVVASFFAFWLPFQLSNILSVFLPSLYSTNWELIAPLHITGTALAYVSCCINPVIYVASAKGLHIRVFKFRPGQLRQLLTEDPESKSHPLSTGDSEVPKSQTRV